MKTKTETDNILVEEIKSENLVISEKAFTKFFEKYYERLMRYTQSIVYDEELRREAVLDTFMKAKGNIGKFNEEMGTLSTFVFNIAKNTCIDKLRRKKNNEICFSDLELDYSEEHNFFQCVCPSDNAEEIKIKKEKAQLIIKIIKAMKHKSMSTIIRLRFYKGMSYEEICKVTGLPLGTVKVTILRGKKMLKKEFEKANIKWE